MRCLRRLSRLIRVQPVADNRTTRAHWVGAFVRNNCAEERIEAGLGYGRLGGTHIMPGQEPVLLRYCNLCTTTGGAENARRASTCNGGAASCVNALSRMCASGGMRHSWLRGLIDVSKRYLVAVAAHNFGCSVSAQVAQGLG
jgi:hypothetical protein